MFDRDSGHKTFLEDAFENEERRIPGGNWGPASSHWANVVCSTGLKDKKTKKKQKKKNRMELLLFRKWSQRKLAGTILLGPHWDPIVHVSIEKKIIWMLPANMLFR